MAKNEEHINTLAVVLIVVVVAGLIIYLIGSPNSALAAYATVPPAPAPTPAAPTSATTPSNAAGLGGAGGSYAPPTNTGTSTPVDNSNIGFFQQAWNFIFAPATDQVTGAPLMQ